MQCHLNTFFILSLLLDLLFMFSVAVQVSVGGCMWIEDSDVNVRPIKASAPKAVGSNVQPSTILNIASYLLSINGLKV